MPSPPHNLPMVEMASDASGSWGCGAWHGSSWFQVPWDDSTHTLSIAAKKLIPIILACVAWWHTHQVRCWCDNQVVVAALHSRSSRDAGVMHLLRCLIFVEAQVGFRQYIDTHSNHLADDLSRNRVFSFLSKVPSADRHPALTSTHLLELLLNPQADPLPLPCHRTPPLLIFCTPCGPRSGTSDYQGLLGGGSQHPAFLRPPRSPGEVIIACTEAGPGRDQRVRALKGPPSRPRLPITVAVMDRIRAYLVQSDHLHKDVVWAICCTAFFGFFRLGELLPESRAQITPAVSLMWGDVAVDSRERPTMVRVRLKRSKCDQFGAGADIILGRTGLPLCPVIAILKFIEIRGSSAGPFFQGSDAQPVLKAWFVEQLRGILAAVGLPQLQYAGHSFRIGAATTAAIGAATTAALAGVEDSTIQTLGCWHSAAYLQYIRMPSERLANLSSVLARSTSHTTRT